MKKHKKVSAKKQAKKSDSLTLFNFKNAMILLLIIALLAILKAAFEPGMDLEEEAEIVLYTLTNGDAKVGVVESNQLIEEKVRNLYNMDYDEMKGMIGVTQDFCIFFEDTTGNVIEIDGLSSGIGSERIQINGNPCR